ncbi:MAG: hypothetical protein VX228_15345, partial [Pseudomonadota bacterium]|nr:hypothetical protein [Pseudomonadota bacterium]
DLQEERIARSAERERAAHASLAQAKLDTQAQEAEELREQLAAAQTAAARLAYNWKLQPDPVYSPVFSTKPF